MKIKPRHALAYSLALMGSGVAAAAEEVDLYLIRAWPLFPCETALLSNKPCLASGMAPQSRQCF